MMTLIENMQEGDGRTAFGGDGRGIALSASSCRCEIGRAEDVVHRLAAAYRLFGGSKVDRRAIGMSTDRDRIQGSHGTLGILDAVHRRVIASCYIAIMFNNCSIPRLLSGVFLLAVVPVSAQLNITELGNLSYQALRNSDLSNIWGYTDELGNEYALVGVNGSGGNTGGLSVVNVTDPADPQEIFFTPGPTSIWREIKVYQDHAYMTTEAEAGLYIVDLSPLPQSSVLPVTLFNGDGWSTSHSLFIDETNGRLYLNGSNRGNGGVIMYDLTQDPEAPVEIGEFDQWYVHDCYARGNLLYNAHISDGFMSIVDVTDPASPVLLGTQATPNTFTHNCWLDDSGQYIFTTDERPDSYLAAYDVSDPTDIQFLDKLQTSPGSQAIIHNTYWLNDYVIQSYYTEGVSIYDVSDPTNIIETGHYDTSPFTGDGFNGAWGVYPFAPSGNLFVSDIEGGLYILGPTYTPACRLEGIITNVQTLAPVGSATLTLTSTSASDITGFDGLYSTGTAVAGTYQVLVSAAGYEDATIEGVVLLNGQVTTLDVALVPLESFVFGGLVSEAGSNSPIAGAVVNIHSDLYDFNTTSDANGQFTLPAVFEGTYTITAGLWGYHTVCLGEQLLSQATSDIIVLLPIGYADDFALDLGWTVTGDAPRGVWERGEPVGTEYNNSPCAPDVDVDGDCADQAYVTGNDGGDAGNDDVDNGFTRLTSPVFDATGAADPWVRYYRWFFNDGGSGSLNDSFLLQLTNGNATVTLEEVTANDPGAHTWVMRQWAITSLLPATATMQFIAYTADVTPGHLVEAAIDRFEVLPNSPFLGLEEEELTSGVYAVPNPSEGTFTVLSKGILNGRVRVMDVQGREVALVPLVNGKSTVRMEGVQGVYLLRVEGTDGTQRTLRAVIR